MRFSVLALLLTTAVSTAFVMGACSLESADEGGGGDPDGSAGEGGAGDPDGSADIDGSAKVDSGDAGGTDGAIDGAVDAGTPAVQFIGRFDTGDVLGPRTAWPGTRIVATFDGTGVDVKLTQTNGFSGGPTYFNIIVDGAFTNMVSVTGTQTIAIASGLAAGPHTIELEKRTEAPFGTVRFEGFTFAGGAGLLPPPARLARRLEFLGDSTIDGYGVDGDRNVTCTGGTAPPVYNDVRKSVAWKTAKTVGAELSLMGYSAKGIARNEDGQVVDPFPTVYARTLPDVAGAWNFASYVPDAVVITLGGSDYSGDPNGTFPADFTTAYAQLVTDIRARYGAATHVFLTVWSQHKGYNNVRQTITAAINTVVAARPAGEKTYAFSFTESPNPDLNETGCQYHANDQHHTNMAAELVTFIKGKIPGW